MPFARWLFAVRLLIHFSQVLHGCDSDNGAKVGLPVTRTWFNIGGHPSTDALRITERRMVTVWVTLGRRTST